MTESNSKPPFYFEPSRQSLIAVLLILIKLIRILISQLWPILLIFLFRQKPGQNRWLVWIILVLGAFSLARSLLIYFRTRFYVKDDEFVLEKGGLVRSRLSIPLDNIQTITFSQSFLHRVFGVVAIEIDTSGAKGSEVSINALNRQKASELREFLLAWKKDNQALPAEGSLPPAESAPEKTLLKLGIGDLIRIGLTQNHLRSTGILIGLVMGFADDIEPIIGQSVYDYLNDKLNLSLDFFWTFALWITVFVLIISVFATLILTVVRFFGLRFVQTGEGFRLEAGLFTRQEQATYLPKIQFLNWSANPLQHLLGIYDLRVYQAAGHELNAKQIIQVPGCYPAQIDAVREAYTPGSGGFLWKWLRPHRYYLYRRLVFIGLLPLIGLATKTAVDFSWYWLVLTLLWSPLTFWWQLNVFHRKQYGLSEEGLWAQAGFFTFSNTFLLWQKVQSVDVQQSIIESRYGLADVIVHTASGKISISSIPLDAGKALRDYIMARLEGYLKSPLSQSNAANSPFLPPALQNTGDS